MNNKGFGLRQEIIVGIVMFIILLFVTIEIRNLYSDISKDTSNAGKIDTKETKEVEKKDYYDDLYYYQLEGKIRDATYLYISNKEVEFTSNIISINSDTLINSGYLNNLVDEKGNKCTSNSLASKDSVGTVIVDVRLVCDNYSTQRK